MVPSGEVTIKSKLLTNFFVEKEEPLSSDHVKTTLNFPLFCVKLNVYDLEFPEPERTDLSSTQIP